VAITTDRPSLLDFEGFIKKSPGDIVAEIAEARNAGDGSDLRHVVVDANVLVSFFVERSAS
jgi:hypothetical protein